ncbi:MAG: peptidylprolyl isomerase [Helicobacter sp.]|nr:peptidylprolyl isomerase [Helicobacter sp.]
MLIEENKMIEMIYSVKDAKTNEIIDTNDRSKPLKFIFGANQVIPGIETALLGKQKGDKIQTTIEPQEAYGEYNPQMIQELPREQFQGIDLQNGMTLFGQSDDGQNVQVMVHDFTDEIVRIDFNHKLAGKTLLFDIEIVDVYNSDDERALLASDYNINNGGGCGCGGGCSCH